MPFGSRWAAILLFVACVFGFRVCAEAAESRVIGVVRNKAGEGLVGIFVRADEPWGFPSFYMDTTDAEGGFELDLPNGEWRIETNPMELNQRGYFSVSETVTLNNETRSVTLVASRADTALVGRVTDDAGAPVANVRLTASSNNNHFGGETDADGNYRIVVGEGDWRVRFEERELQEHGLILLQSLSAAVVDGIDQRFDIELTRAQLLLVANVLDAEGQPLDGGLVDALREGTVFSTSASIVGGVAELRLSSGPWVVSVWSFSGHKRPPRRRVWMSEERHQVAFTLESQASVEIAGRVIDENGIGVAGVEIEGHGLSGQSGFVQIRPTSADGAFLFSSAAGKVLLAGHDNALIPRTIVDAPAAGRHEAVIRQQRATGEIIVRASAVGPVSNPVPLFTASAFRDGKLYTISAPVYEVLRIPVFDADWKINVDSYGADLLTPAPASIEICGQSETIELRFGAIERSARIRGRVVDAENRAVALAQIKAWRSTLGHVWEYGAADGDGIFEISVAPGDWHVSAYRDDATMALTSTVFARAVEAGETREAGEILWPWSGAPVVVRLTDESGGALDTDWPYIEPWNFRAVFRAEHERGYYEAEPSAPSNAFVFNAMPGRWTFSATPGSMNGVGYATFRPVEIDVPAAGATVDVRVARIAPGSETPHLNMFIIGWSGETSLEVFAEAPRAMRIESSENLLDWRFDSFLERPRELIIGGGAQPRFFRAITEY